MPPLGCGPQGSSGLPATRGKVKLRGQAPFAGPAPAWLRNPVLNPEKRRNQAYDFMKHDSHTPGPVDKVPWGAFWRLVLIQAQNSFNEKGAQFLLIPLGVWLYGTRGDLEYPLGAIIVLPFILIFPLCRVAVRPLLQGAHHSIHGPSPNMRAGGNVLEPALPQPERSLLWFCVFALQATIFSPSKKGIVKDIVGTSRMGFASGIVEMASILSLLIGR